MSSESPDPVVVHIVDDSEAEREFVSYMLSMAGYEVACYASPLRFLQKFPATALGVLLLDYQMPEMTGLELLRRIRLEGFRMPVIVCSAYGSFQLADDFLGLGVSHFLEKPVRKEKLFSVVSDTIGIAEKRHEAWLRSRICKKELAKLTKREREVFDQLIRGKTSKQIGMYLSISDRTAEYHRQNLKKKLGAGTLSDLMRLTNSRR